MIAPYVCEVCPDSGKERITYYKNPKMFGSKLKTLRKKKGLSIEQAADALNWWPEHVVNWEKGEMVSWRTLNRLAEFYGVTTDYLLSDEQEVHLQLF